jgi:hypothetical protein
MRRSVSAILILILGLGAQVWAVAASDTESIESAQSHFAHLKLKQDDLRALASKQVITRGLSSSNSKEIAGFAAVLAEAPPDAFVVSYKSLSTLRNNPNTVAIGRFGATPDLADLDGLDIDDKDIYSLSKSKAGGSDIKLNETEMARLQAVRATAARLTPQIRTRIASEYKKILVERVKSYLAAGPTAMGMFVDKDDPVNAQEAFADLAREQGPCVSNCSHLISYIENYPKAEAPETDSFFYWAKMKFGDLKPVINLIQVVIHREGSRVFIASKQIYSSHYTEAAFSVAELIPFTDGRGQSRTLIAYTIRLQVDMLGGMLGFMKKRMAQPRVLATLKESLNGLRLSMEALSRAATQERVGS